VWSYPCCPPRAASFETDLPGEKTNIDRGKECDCQGRTHNQHNRRRSIKKARARLDRRLNDMSSFLFHNRFQVCPSITTDGRTICSGTQKLNRANWSKGQHQRRWSTPFCQAEIDGGSASKCPSIWTIGVTS
jgi:hypothetical protein